MSYKETLAFLYQQLPNFQQIGGTAYKAGFANILALCEMLDNPHKKIQTIHIAGTNGKGSTAHMLAAILQSAGYKTGLYTSPHLKSFTERIRIDGKEINPETVRIFVEKNLSEIQKIQPSFFEITVAMAFDYFAYQKTDIAVIEVGMGGRLDSTNIILPEISLITNISFDHQQFLGDTLAKIAFEKAGIIKKNIPVVISEFKEETATVFREKAEEEKASIYFAGKAYTCEKINTENFAINVFKKQELYLEKLSPALKGDYQLKNIPGVLKTVEILCEKGWNIHKSHIRKGIEQTVELTGLKGRWQLIQNEPLVICDTAHNQAGIKEVLEQLVKIPHRQLHIILALTKDKDIKNILSLYPSNAFYYFCSYNSPRALEAEKLREDAKLFNLVGELYESVNEALRKAQHNAAKEDIIFVGGSTFLVAELDNL